MNVIAVVSYKAGTGKTTLTAELAAQAAGCGRRCLVIDADPRGDFALMNARRVRGVLPLATDARDLARQLEVADLLGYDCVLIDTAPSVSARVEEAVRLAGMVVIPARPGLSDLADVSRAVDLVQAGGRPYLVVLNAVQVDGADAPAVAESRDWLTRFDIPLWSGQISERSPDQRAGGAAQACAKSATEIMRLWSMIEQMVEPVSALPAAASDAQRAA
jgi:chromosome partitioning protein